MNTDLIVKNSIILYLKMLIQIGVSLYTTRVILNALGVSDFGIYSLLVGAVGMFGFFRASLSSSTIRFLAHSEGKKNLVEKTKIFNISILFHFILAVFFLIFLEIGISIFFETIFNIDNSRIEIAKLISHFVIIISFINIILVPFEGIVNSHENMLFISLVDIIKSALILILALQIVDTKIDKLFFYSSFLMIIWVLVFIIYSFYCFLNYEECKINFYKYYDRNISKSMISFSSIEFIGYSSGIISLYSTNLFVNSFFGTVVNAAQGISNQVNAQLTSFSSTMMRAVKPAIIKSDGAQNYSFLQSSTFNSGKYSFLIMVFVSTPLLIETDFILELWLSDVPKWAIIFCQLQILKNIIEQFFLPFGTAIGARGKIRSYVIANSVNNIMVLPAIYLCFYFGNAPYTMYIVLIFFFSINGFFINMFYSKKILNFDINYFLKKIVGPNILFYMLILLICFMIKMLFYQSFFRLFLIIISSSLLIFILAYKLSSSEEKKYFFSKINSIKSLYGF